MAGVERVSKKAEPLPKGEHGNYEQIQFKVGEPLETKTVKGVSQEVPLQILEEDTIGGKFAIGVL